MNNKWFVVRDGKEQGPFTTQQLKEMAANGKIVGDDLVRRNDMKSAIKAGKVKGLFHVAAPAPTKNVSASPSSELAASSTETPANNKQERGISKRILVIAASVAGTLLLLCCGTCGMIGMIGKSLPQPLQQEIAKQGQQQTAKQDEQHPANKDGNQTAKKPIGTLRPEQEKLIAEIESQTPPIPEFSENDYKHDFTKDDYETIPAGAKKETRTEIIKSDDKEINGKPETKIGYVGRMGKFVQHGAFTTWTDQTKTMKLREGNMLNGKRHGITTYFFPNGKKQNEMIWVQGKRSGIGRGWYENGKPQFENHWVDGQFHGRRHNWHDNGSPELDETWVRGNLHGIAKTWFKDGRLASIACFRDGKRNSKVWSQNEDGSLGETGEWENGKPKGKCRFLFTDSNRQPYYIEVSDDPWNNGTIGEFIARMNYYMLKDRPDLGLQFDPKMKIANYVSPNSTEFIVRFGKPFVDVVDFENAPSGAPAFVRDRYRVWSYACRDGVLRLRVQPTQAGNLMVTAHWRDHK